MRRIAYIMVSSMWGFAGCRLADGLLGNLPTQGESLVFGIVELAICLGLMAYSGWTPYPSDNS